MHDMSNETLARALGEVVRDFERSLDRHLEGLRMQAAAMVAESHAKVAEAEARRDAVLNELVAKVHERLATLKDGRDGKDGEPGEKGDPGADGKDGAPGVDGQPGADGKDGERGEKGEPGEKGADGNSVSVRGTYDPEAEYAEFDIIALGGSSFIAVKDEPGPCPGGGWQLLASRGSRGEKGDRGERGFDGDKGDKGERGAPGDTPAAIYKDGSDIVLTLGSGAELRT